MNTNNMRKSLQFLKKLSNLKIFFWTIIGLMIVTIIGTIEQKHIGLFAAQEKYFSSYFFIYKGVPLPGGGLLICVLTIGLLSQLIFKTSYKSFAKSGITLTHIGAIILLIGSFITYISAIEGSLVLKENESKSSILDYRNYDLTFSTEDFKQDFKTYKLDHLPTVFKNAPIEVFPNVVITDLKIMKTCTLVPNLNSNEFEVGFAKLFKFETENSSKQKPQKQEIQNEKCVEFSLKENSNIQVFRVFLNMPKTQSFKIGRHHGFVLVKNREIPLPFSVKLLDFEKKFHQGTMISKSFKSLVEIKDGSQVFRRLIEMNAPLRYKGFTFYQSSFSENSEGEMSELAVVQNKAQWFPYVSSIILCLGVLWHLILISRQKGQSK